MYRSKPAFVRKSNTQNLGGLFAGILLFIEFLFANFGFISSHAPNLLDKIWKFSKCEFCTDSEIFEAEFEIFKFTTRFVRFKAKEIIDEALFRFWR
jgi:hypothetical protein